MHTRSVVAALLFGLVLGCSSDPPPPGSSKTSKVLPGVKDKDAGTSDPVPTKSDEKAIAVVEAAIKAHGGMDALAKLSAIDRSVKGSFRGPSQEVDFTAETLIQLPKRLRQIVTADAGEAKAVQTFVLDGESGWQVSGGETIPLPEERSKEFRDLLFGYSIATLLPLRDDGITLVLLPEETIDGNGMTVVRAVKKDQPDVRLYFDKKSNMLHKIAYRTTLGGASANWENAFLDYKDVDGAKVPHHQMEFLNGARVAEWKITNIRVARKFDSGLFGRP